MSKRIYVASSWRNHFQQKAVDRLRRAGLEVYDFRNPRDGDSGFHWSEIDVDWHDWDQDSYIAALSHPAAASGFESDFDAMKWADAFLLVQPCGRSAHLELGWAVGAGKETCVWMPGRIEPELMLKMADYMTADLDDAVHFLCTCTNEEAGKRRVGWRS